MNVSELTEVFKNINNTMAENRDYLVSLDQENGDGDLGIYMCSGFSAVVDYLTVNEFQDFGIALNKVAGVFNDAAPSSLGTVITFILKGMAKSLKGKSNIHLTEVSQAFLAGITNVTEKVGTQIGEKTILDSLYPAAIALRGYTDDVMHGLKKAMEEGEKGSQLTKTMRAVWGRAAYYGENSIGVIDGGSVVGALIFKSIYEWYSKTSQK